MSRGRCPGAIAAVALAAATPAAARAYHIQHSQEGAELHWPSFPVPYQVVLDHVRPLDRAWVLRDVRRGPEAWTLPAGSAASYVYIGTSTLDAVDAPGIVKFVYWTRGWPSDLGDPTITIGSTALTYDPTSGEVSAAFVAFNAEGFRFTDEAPNPDAIDLWTVSAHEAGHVLGLGHPCGDLGTHNCNGANVAETSSLMYPETEPGYIRRFPNPDDLAAIVHLYGPSDTAPPYGTVADRRCAQGTLVFVPGPGSATPGSFETVDAESGAMTPISFTAGPDGDHLDTTVPAGHLLDLVVAGASGKARALYGALAPPAPCSAGGAPPVPAGCGCDPVPGAGGAGALLLALGALGLRGLGRPRRGHAGDRRP